MRKIFLSLTVVGLLGLTSCQDDFMDFEPSASTVVNDETIQNEAQLQLAVLGAYDAIQSNFAYGNYYITAQEILSDNGFVKAQSSNRFNDFYQFTHATSTGGSISNMWTIGYRAIARTNFVLSFQDKFNSDEAKLYFAEAKAIRSIVLFNLVNYYARPYGTIDQDLGIPVPTIFESGTQLPRLTVEEVYQEIISQLEEAVIDLPTVGDYGTYRFTKKAAYGLLSRAYLYKKDYQKAIENADLAMANATLLGIDSDLIDYYLNPSSNNETLFAIGFSELDNPNANDALYATWSKGRYEDTAATSEFVSILDEGDIRHQLYEAKEDVNDNPVPYWVYKFGPLDNDVVVLRATEAMLNKIEALYYTNPGQAQTELVNWVKNNRNASYDFNGSGQDLLDEILRQRRIELAFEGHRYFDLGRYGLDIHRGANSTAISEIPFSDYRRVFPIPLNEMNTNRHPQMVQNPTYQ